MTNKLIFYVVNSVEECCKNFETDWPIMREDRHKMIHINTIWGRPLDPEAAKSFCVGDLVIQPVDKITHALYNLTE